MEYTLFGNGMDRIPDFAFKGMTFLFLFWDFFREITAQFSRRLARFGIESGHTVIDYGCGPGGYLKAASSLVGEDGKVYAVDIHPLAIEAVRKKIAKYGLRNVAPLLTNSYHCNLEDRAADVIYALDMFHMVKNPNEFLTECHRLLKKEGHLIIDDGHQSRKETRRKIAGSQLWKIDEETRSHLRCTPA